MKITIVVIFIFIAWGILGQLRKIEFYAHSMKSNSTIQLTKFVLAPFWDPDSEIVEENINPSPFARAYGLKGISKEQWCQHFKETKYIWFPFQSYYLNGEADGDDNIARQFNEDMEMRKIIQKMNRDDVMKMYLANTKIKESG